MTDGVGGMLLVIAAALLYFLPAIIGRKKRNANAICVLNLFLGWTVIGWVVALVWACTAEAPEPATAAPVDFRCPRCKNPLTPDAAFCGNCGVAFTKKKCPDCAEMIQPDARKCRFCGRVFESSATA
jgi:Superinfection immunity protein/Double zinc ribbon